MIDSAISILAGVVVGFALGLTGGGGSIFAVPLLVYVVGLDIHLALGTSLASVGVTSLIGAISRIYHKQADLRVGGIFAACAVGGTYLGTRLNAEVKGPVLLVLFAGLMIYIAVNMWRRSVKGRRVPANSEAPAKFPLLCAAGLGTGFTSGFFGVGGGFLIVPALIFFARLEMHRAAATSLCVIAVHGLTGILSYAVQGRPIDYNTAGLFIAGGFFGVQIGEWWCTRLSRKWLMRIFAVMILAIALLLMAENLPKLGQ
jgi:uncharacterized membrane protein YfcA